MDDDLDWPPNCRAVPEARAAFAREHAARRAHGLAQDLQRRELIVLRRRVASLERRLAMVVAPSGELTEAFVTAWAKAISDVVRDYVAKRLGEVQTRIGDEARRVEDRLAEVERQQLRFCGVHEPGRSYRANSLVVKRGGLWIALADTTGTPGSDGA